MTGRYDPFLNFRFRIEIDGIQQAGFRDVTGFDANIGVVYYREGTDPKYVRKLSGLATFGPLLLKWGATSSLDIYNWFKAGIDGAAERKNISIIAVNENGDDEARWNIMGAWPSKYIAPAFDAMANEIAIEALEITFERIDKVG
ncbi:MAG: phage tail protein [Methanomassiliicoccaceae archaeon]|nr:phage tail protein [Methanomassiliicoccaceae archaeon]